MHTRPAIAKSECSLLRSIDQVGVERIQLEYIFTTTTANFPLSPFQLEVYFKVNIVYMVCTSG